MMGSFEISCVSPTFVRFHFGLLVAHQTFCQRPHIHSHTHQWYAEPLLKYFLLESKSELRLLASLHKIVI